MKQRGRSKQEAAAAVATVSSPISSSPAPPSPVAGLLSPSSHLLLRPLIVCYAFLLLTVTALVNLRVPEPYMDEPFHAQQTAAYCRHQWDTWDPKITTFPGLYLSALALHGPVSWLLGAEWSCALLVLRFYNVVWATAAFALYFLLLGHKRAAPPRLSHRLIAALRFGLFPVHLFYAPLYYTDAFSTFTVLLLLYSAQSPAALLSSPVSQLLVAALSVLARQTNVLWVAFTALDVVLRHSSTVYADGQASTSSSSLSSLPVAAARLLQWMWSHPLRLLRLVWPYAVVVTAFVGFLIANGGSVVVGDQSHHRFTLHLGQLLHFAAFTAAFLGCRLLIDGTLPAFLQACTRSPGRLLSALAAFLVVAAILNWFTFSHPFLLADNRHVSFYVWRYLFGRHALLRLILAPAYVLALYGVQRLISHQPVLLQVGLFVCIAAALVPSPLLEFRYFIVPFSLIALLSEGKDPESKQLVARGLEASSQARLLLADMTQLALYVAVDAAMLYRFLFRPYTWDDGSVARFMW